MENLLVVFELAGEHYGVEISAIESIIEVQPITRVPHAPDFVIGVTSLRQQVLPVIDLRARLGLPCAQEDKNSRIIIARLGEQAAGMIVDGVSEVLRISDEAVESVPPMATAANAEYVRGIARLEERLILLLDLDKVLTTGEQAHLLSLAEAV